MSTFNAERVVQAINEARIERKMGNNKPTEVFKPIIESQDSTA